MQRVKIGLIGCGVVGRIHLEFALRTGVIDVTAVADTNAAASRSAAEKFGVVNAYDNGFALIDDPEVEAVIVALPASVRMEFVLRTLAKGKHVMIEKPTGMNAGEIEVIMKAHAEAGSGVVASSCVSRFSYLESAGKLADFIAADGIGAIRLVRCRSIRPAGAPPVNPPFWRFSKSANGGGIMANWGTYDLDYLLGIGGDRLKPLNVLARTWSVPGPLTSHVAPGSDAETHLTAFLQCESGAAFMLERAEVVAARGENSWEIIGEKGSLSFTMVPEDGKEIWFHRADAEHGTVSERIWSGDESYDTTHEELLRDFALAIREKREPRGSLAHALLIQRIIDGIYVSSDKSCLVSLQANLI